MTAKDAKSSLTLGNVTDTFEFDDHPQSFPIKISLFDMKPLFRSSSRWQIHPPSSSIRNFRGKKRSLSANGQRTIHVAIDASKYKEELKQAKILNGYFLRIFVLV